MPSLRSKTAFSLLGLAVLLVLSILLAVTIGPAELSVQQVYRVILDKAFGLSTAGEPIRASVYDIVWLIRLPRILLAVGVGAALAVSGCVMQAIVQNPLADPYILGVSSGASLGATLAILLGFGSLFGSNSVGISAFIGAFGISLLVQIIANIGGKANTIRLLLGGMALSAVCTAFSSFIVFFAKNKEGIRNVVFWTMGSLAGATWKLLAVILPVVLLGTLFFISQTRILNLMLLGDEVAITLGRNLLLFRNLYLLLSALMIGMVVYASGLIGFVGLIIPHMVRFLYGTDHRRVLPLSALLASIFLIWMDVLSRVIVAGAEIPIGIMISLIGAPSFIYLLMKRSYGFGGSA